MKIERVVAIAALAFLGISSIVGAVPLILDPSGGLLRMPLSLLRYSPFHSFLIPGIILLLTNGALSLIILVAEVRRVRGHALLVTLQGCVLAGWIGVEMIMLHVAMWAQFVYLGVALVLIVSGLVLTREAQAANK